MTTEIEQTEEQTTENVTPQVTEPTEAENIARLNGWRPKEEFEGDVSKWVDAEEFNRRGELFSKIESVSKELKDTRKALKALQEHHSKVKESEYARALETLKAEKKAALEEGDATAVIDIDEKIVDLKTQQQVQRAADQQTARQPDPRFVAWTNDNTWYVKDSELRDFADEVGTLYSHRHPDKDPVEVLEYVKNRVKREFPEKFTNPNRNKPNNVETGNQHAAKSRDTFTLTAEEESAMKTFVREGIMTKEEYIAELKRVKGVA